MTRETWGYVFWGAMLALLFGVPEILAAFGLTPWPTLSEAAWNLEAKSHWVSIVMLAGLAVLLVHIIFGPDGPAGLK